MTTEVKLDGRSRLAGEVNALKRYLRRSVAVALLESAGRVADTARTRVLALRDPRRPGPSALADSIEAVETEDGAAVDATAEHAPYVEFGTRRMPARPFLQPALAAEREGIIARVGQALRDAKAGTP